MRRAFCFSRSWRRYSLSRMRPRPCWPGGYGLRSTGHFIVSHLGPLRNSFMRSRRHSLQTGPVYRAIRRASACGGRGSTAAGAVRPSRSASDAPPLGGTAPIVRDGRDVLDSDDFDARVLDRPDGGLATRARSLHDDVDLADAVLHRASRGRLRRELRGERRGLARALEADVARRRPGDHVALLVGDRDDRVVERRLDVRGAVGDVLALTPPRPSSTRRWLRHPYFLARFLPATVFFGPFLVRAFVRVRCPCTGRPRR